MTKLQHALAENVNVKQEANALKVIAPAATWKMPIH
jgi:hypothetical protein